MRELQALSVMSGEHGLLVLDQTCLPAAEKWVKLDSISETVAAIKSLKVRGAPLIGVVAALSLAHAAERGMSESDLDRSIEELRSARPTAVNLMNAMDRLKKVRRESSSASEFVSAAEEIFIEDQALCSRLSILAGGLIEDCDQVMTICNTGGLATAGVGTALAGFRWAHENHRRIHVYVNETRPLLQGARLTAWELGHLGIPHTLICDNMAGFLMAQKKINKIFVGADRIARNGDFANKIGTYSLAVLAKYHQIPFYVVAPQTTVDSQIESGSQIPIENRAADEVRGAKGSFGEVIWAPEKTRVYNPAFDMTPADLVTGWVLDTGVFSAGDVAKGALVAA